jgi:hypothetical protein
MRIDSNGLEILGRDECRSLLSSTDLGRVAVCMHALPVVLPVSYGLLNDDIIVRVGNGTKLSAALSNTVVAFEVDSFDVPSHTGWSVLVQGVADRVDDIATLSQAARLPLPAWSDAGTSNYIRIRSQEVTGRRLDAGLNWNGVEAASSSMKKGLVW